MVKDDSKITDVAKPGESTPETSGRPIIASHGPMVQDPMMKNAAKAEQNSIEEAAKKPAPVAPTKKTISPISLKDKPESENQSETSESAAVDAVVEQAETTSKKKDGQLSLEEKAQQEALDKLIADKKYFVPIAQAQHRRNNRRAMIALPLIILLALAGAYLALDAGLIKTNIKLPISFVNN